MATETVVLPGTAKWAYTSRLDKYGSYSIVIYPDAESLEKVRDLTEKKPAILNRLRKDDDGYFIKFKCDPEKVIGGTTKVFSVHNYKADGKTPLTDLIGNGSDVTSQLDVYTFRKGEGKAARLKAVRVNNLIIFEPNQLPTEEQNEELEKQPVPVWG